MRNRKRVRRILAPRPLQSSGGRLRACNREAVPFKLRTATNCWKGTRHDAGQTVEQAALRSLQHAHDVSSHRANCRYRLRCGRLPVVRAADSTRLRVRRAAAAVPLVGSIRGMQGGAVRRIATARKHVHGLPGADAIVRPRVQQNSSPNRLTYALATRHRVQCRRRQHRPCSSTPRQLSQTVSGGFGVRVDGGVANGKHRDFASKVYVHEARQGRKRQAVQCGGHLFTIQHLRGAVVLRHLSW